MGTGGVHEVLTRRGDDTRSPEHVRDELVALGPRALAELFDLATGAGLEQLFESGTPLVIAPDRLRPFALEAMRRFPPSEVRGLLRGVLAEGYEVDRWMLALDLVGGRGGTAALWWDFSRGFERLAWRSRTVHEHMLDALVGLLRVEPEQFGQLEELAADFDEETLAMCVGAVLAADQPRGIDLLLSSVLEPLGQATRLDALGRLAERFPWYRALEVETFIQTRLNSSEHSVQRAAIRWSGRLHLTSAIDLLLPLVENDAARSRVVASEALRALLGPRGVRPWSEHVRRELAFQQGAAAVLLSELSGVDAATCVQHMRELAGHPIVLHDLARELGTEFGQLPQAALPVVVHTLASIGSRHAVPGLVDALYGPDPTRARHAWRALTALTELELPCEAPPWVRAFGL